MAELNDKLITYGNLSTFYDKLQEQGLGGNTIEDITYSELKSLRDNSGLTAGQQYRITDYVTTTAQENTQSAGHQFDIIVTADDVDKLNENARATQHSGDTYFANSKLESWELKYCLDNDIDRFSWAIAGGKYLVCGDEIDCAAEDWTGEGHYYIDLGDYKYYYEGTIEDNGTTYYIWSHNYVGKTGIIKVLTTQDTYTNTPSGTNSNGCEYYDTVYNVVGEITIDGEEFSELYKSAKRIIKTEDSPSGKGVIYYMKDEFNNECPYDFKNILFSYEDLTAHEYYYCYTFTYHYDGGLIADATIVGNDGSLFDSNGYVAGCYRNVIKEYRKEQDELPKLLTLNDIVFYDSQSVQSGEYNGCYDNYFDYDCYSNRLSNVKGNKFGIGCFTNTLENCTNNTFGDICLGNIFKLCQNNVFGNGCTTNRIYHYFILNVVGNNCNSIKNYNVYMEKNKFGNNCDDLDFTVNYSNYSRLQNLYILDNSSFPNGVPSGINDYNDYLKFVGRNSQGTFTVKNPLD